MAITSSSSSSIATGSSSTSTATMSQHHQDESNKNGRQIYNDLKPRQKVLFDLHLNESSMTESREDGSNSGVSLSSSTLTKTKTSDLGRSLSKAESTSFDVDDATVVDSTFAKMKSTDNSNLYSQDNDNEYIYRTPYCSHDYFYFLKKNPPRPYAKNFMKRSTRKIITYKDYEHRDDLPMMPSLTPTLDEKNNNNNPPRDVKLGVVPYDLLLKTDLLSLIDIEKREEVEEEEEDNVTKEASATTAGITTITGNNKVNIPDLVSDYSKDSKNLLPKFPSSTYVSPKTSELMAKDDTSSNFFKANAAFKNTSRASFTSMDAIRAKGAKQDVGVSKNPPRRKTIHGARAA